MFRTRGSAGRWRTPDEGRRVGSRLAPRIRPAFVLIWPSPPPSIRSKIRAMKAFALSVFAASVLPLSATTISVVPIHEPISMHGTDVDDVVTDTGEVLQASIVSRPMALTGAFPEVLVESIRTPHQFPTNNRS